MFGFLIKLKLYIVPAFHHQNMSDSETSLVHLLFEEGKLGSKNNEPPPHLYVRKFARGVSAWLLPGSH